MKESRCTKCGEVVARYPDNGGVIIPSSGHYCKGTIGRAERDLVRVIGWPRFNELKAKGRTQELTRRMAALELLYKTVKVFKGTELLSQNAADVMDELEGMER